VFVGWIKVAVGLIVLESISIFYRVSGRSDRLADAAHFTALWVAFAVTGEVQSSLILERRSGCRCWTRSWPNWAER